MPGVKVPATIFKGDVALEQFSCVSCKLLLKDPVQSACGHRICKSCADEIIGHETRPQCPECGEEFEDEDGAQYFPDRFVRREINNLEVICTYSNDGCNWEGKFHDYEQHVNSCKYEPKPDICPFTTTVSPTQSLNSELIHVPCEMCQKPVRLGGLQEHYRVCPFLFLCPLNHLGCPHASYMDQTELAEHMETSHLSHLVLLVRRLLGLSNHLENRVSTREPHVDFGVDDNIHPRQQLRNLTEQHEIELRNLMSGELHNMQNHLFVTMTEELQGKDKEIALLKAQITKLEKTVRSKNAEIEDRDFRLSLIENSNHDGSMIWKIPQFSQRKADALNGKYTSIFSLPFYSGKYGYKMCLRLYIMGDGIGKGTHLSLFFVVMRGEFDNLLQWPFTHKVTFKLINQAGGRDIVDTFQPDPISSSFRKPKSDMNIASGCPRFVSHTELERGGFIVDDTIFIKCMIDVSTIRHP